MPGWQPGGMAKPTWRTHQRPVVVVTRPLWVLVNPEEAHSVQAHRLAGSGTCLSLLLPLARLLLLLLTCTHGWQTPWPLARAAA